MCESKSNNKHCDITNGGDKLHKEVRLWSKTAIWGFILVAGFWVAALGFALFFKLDSPPVVKYVGVAGAILSLVGGVICIAKRGVIRGIGFSISGVALFSSACGLAVSTLLVFENRDTSLAIVIFFPVAFAAIPAVVLYVLYLLLRRDN